MCGGGGPECGGGEAGRVGSEPRAVAITAGPRPRPTARHFVGQHSSVHRESPSSGFLCPKSGNACEGHSDAGLGPEAAMDQLGMCICT